ASAGPAGAVGRAGRSGATAGALAVGPAGEGAAERGATASPGEDAAAGPRSRATPEPAAIASAMTTTDDQMRERRVIPGPATGRYLAAIPRFALRSRPR